MRVHFISASPPQIGRAIRKKLELDGIIYDGIVFKDQLQRLMRGKFRHLREQVGYKLTELLKARASGAADGARVPVRRRLGVRSADLLAVRRRRRRAASRRRRWPSSCAPLRVDPPLIEEACALAAERAAGARPWRASSSISSAARRRRRFASTGRAWCRRSTTSRRRPASSQEGVAQPAARSSRGAARWSRSRPTRRSDLANSLADIERRGHLGAQHARGSCAPALARVPGMLPARAPAGGLARARWWRWPPAPPRRRVAATGALIDYRAIVGHRDGSRGGGGMTRCAVVLVTVPSREEAEHRRGAVGERLAACVNIVGPIRSVYRWRASLPRRRAPADHQDDARALRGARGARARAAPVRGAGVIALPIELGRRRISHGSEA